MESIPYSDLSKGTFLIATPEIESGIFFRGVVLLCEHTSTGSFGLLVNKKLELELPSDILNVEQLANPHIELRVGGPLQTNQMMLLHNSDKVPQQTMEICEGVYLGGDVQFLQEMAADENGPDMRLCFGYIGWGEGILEREFLDGNWFLCRATADKLFHAPSERLWQALLREMGGKYATLSMIPEDLSLN
jgi:putative transcriptional regulator